MKFLLTPTPLIAIEISDATLEYTLPKGSENELLVLGEEGAMTIQFKDVKFESIIGSVDKGVIDFDCEPYLEKNDMFTTAKYTVYDRDDTYTPYADYSFKTLLASHSLSLDKKYLIIKPKN
jgi:hypothetical protein